MLAVASTHPPSRLWEAATEDAHATLQHHFASDPTTNSFATTSEPNTMSTNARAGGASASNGSTSATEPTYFEQQRALLVGEIAQSMEHVLQNINKLNRSLEGVIAVGNEFSSVEALWSQFENVLAKEPDASVKAEERGEGEEGVTAGSARS